MAKLPIFLQQFRVDAKKKIHQKDIREVIFSEGTYQIEVFDNKTKTCFWPFLQVDEKENLIDYFCSCKDFEKNKACSHLAAAYLVIFTDNLPPLHERFKQSFWNDLFEALSSRLGYEATALQKQKDEYVATSSTKKQLFFIKPLTKEAKEKLAQIIDQGKVELFETSFKFLNLSQEERKIWRSAKTSSSIQYKLSFWIDIAQWLFMLQEKSEKYQITFSGEREKIPHKIKVCFAELSFEAYISDVIWSKIIPALRTVDSPLKVFGYDEQIIDKVIFQKEDFSFEIHYKKESISLEKKGIAIHNWIYVPKEGFYAKSLLQKVAVEKISKKQIPKFLSHNSLFLQKHVKNVEICKESIPVKYHLFFDEKQNLHICMYLFEKQDLQGKQVVLFDSWVYIPEKGFIPIEDIIFTEKETIIPKDKVASFVTRHRMWLHNYEGFSTHFGKMQSYVTYKVSTEGDLFFDTKWEFSEDSENYYDFGEWIYIPSIGFYAKHIQNLLLPITPGLKIEKKDVDSFITKNIEELEQVPYFFTSFNPLQKAGLEILLNKEQKIQVIPKYHLIEEIETQDVIFYEKYLYLRKRGFFAIPTTFLLPANFTQKKNISRRDESYFLKVELPKILPFVTFLDKRLQKPKFLKGKIKKLIKEKKHARLQYLVDLIYESELGYVHAADIFSAIKENKKYIFSDAGLIFLHQPRFNWMKYLKSVEGYSFDNLFELSSLEWMRLFLFEDIEEPKNHSVEAREIHKILQELQNFSAEEMLDISLLQAKLRPYQEKGVQWLWFLYCHSLSGLLCDDMGLGKTHQAMALMAAIAKKDPEKIYKYLVICPTSVIYHWQELLHKFLPHLRVLTYHGTFRDLENFTKKYDLLLTSYGIYRYDFERLQHIGFEVAIFDEMQIAKNALSKTNKALRSIDARMKIGLTGTPIENNLQELKALFDVILPGYFPPDTAFREHFLTPIEKHKDEQRQKLLKKLIYPFIMRRKKIDVLLDLPEKTEEIAYCDLSEEQKELYHKLIQDSKKQIVTTLQDTKKAVPYLHIFTLFSKLKQVCDHPCLLLQGKKAFHKHHSGKWDLFVELLNEARDSNQKVVIFSQYLEMIAIMEEYLQKKNIGFASIKGETKKRHEQLKRFKEDPRCEVFIGSLLAAGVGIDLSSASVVIHYDRWWNPAKENQATDRVHRIGQSRGVQVFKLVTKNTIEEHIHRLIEKKKDLMEKLISCDEIDQIKVLSREEIIQLLQKLDI